MTNNLRELDFDHTINDRALVNGEPGTVITVSKSWQNPSWKTMTFLPDSGKDDKPLRYLRFEVFKVAK